MRTRIAAQGPSMQLPCRRLRRPRRVLRHGPAASCSAPMASRLRRSTRKCGGCLPRRRDRLDRLDSVGFDQGRRNRVPSRPASPQKVSRGRRAAALGCRMPTSGASRSAPAALVCKRHGASVPDAGASPRRTPECASIPETAPGRRHPAMDAPPNAGFPPAVRSPGLPELPPTTPRKGGFKVPAEYTRHQSGTSAACLAPLPPLRSSDV